MAWINHYSGRERCLHASTMDVPTSARVPCRIVSAPGHIEVSDILARHELHAQTSIALHRVARILGSITDDEEMIAAVRLHDVAEDPFL